MAIILPILLLSLPSYIVPSRLATILKIHLSCNTVGDERLVTRIGNLELKHMQLVIQCNIGNNCMNHSNNNRLW